MAHFDLEVNMSASRSQVGDVDQIADVGRVQGEGQHPAVTGAAQDQTGNRGGGKEAEAKRHFVIGEDISNLYR